MRFGLSDEIVNEIIAVIGKCKAVRKAVIFGSRARGDFQYNSDIDIALYANGEPYPGLFMDIDDAAGIYKTNVVDMDRLANEKLKQNIEREGIEIYRRMDK